MPELNRRYLLAHMSQQSGSPATAEEQEAAASFADQLIDQLLGAGQEEFSSDEEVKEEIQLSVPVTLRPVVAPMGGCIEVCIGVGIAEVCYHRGFKGDRPSKG